MQYKTLRRMALMRVYLQNLGIFRGLATYIRLRLPKQRIQIKPPGSLAPIELRARTTDVTVFEQVFVVRQYETEMPKRPRLIIDGGAHIGCATSFFANKYPDAVIISVEPDAENFDLLL